MRIDIKFKANESPIELVMNSHINGFVNKVLGENNKWHGKFSDYSVSCMYGGVRQKDGTVQYPNGGYFSVSSPNKDFIGDFITGLLELDDTTKILSMPFDGFSDPYEPQIMSDYSIIYMKNVYLQWSRKDMEKKIFTFENCEDYINKLYENCVKKLMRAGVAERTAKSLKFIPFHKNGWKVIPWRYKMHNNHPLAHHTSKIALVVTGSRKARKVLFEMGIGNSTGFGFGFVELPTKK